MNITSPNHDTQPGVHLHIERLVLEGLSLAPPDQVRVQTALETELSRLLTGVPVGQWSGGAFAWRACDPVHLAPGGSPKAWGHQIARTLFATLAPAPPPNSRSVR